MYDNRQRIINFPAIGKLKKLRTLYLQHCNLITLSSEIGDFTNLTELSLQNCNLTVLPKEIGNLTSLWTLRLQNCNLAIIPKEIGNLNNLRDLNLGYNNKLTLVPKEIGQLKNMTTLNLQRCNLTILPKEIGDLTNLQYLEVSGNKNLAEIPMGQLKQPIMLGISDTKVASHKVASHVEMQTPPAHIQRGENDAYDVVDKPAKFPGGDIEFTKFTKKNLIYPKDALKNNVEGMCM